MGVLRRAVRRDHHSRGVRRARSGCADGVVFCSHVEWSTGRVNDVAAVCVAGARCGRALNRRRRARAGSARARSPGCRRRRVRRELPQVALCAEGRRVPLRAAGSAAADRPAVVSWDWAAPFGAQSHLWQFPAYTSAPTAGRFRSSCPGACAPSTIESAPAARARAHTAATSLTRPVDHSTCEQKTTRVCGRGTSSSNGTRVRVAPVHRATNSQRSSMPPYSASASSTSSPLCRSSDRAAALSATVAFVANTRSPRGAPTKSARRLASRLEPLRETALRREELDRPPLELELEALVGLEDGPRARAEGAVVQEDRRRDRGGRDPSQRRSSSTAAPRRSWKPFTALNPPLIAPLGA